VEDDEDECTDNFRKSGKRLSGPTPVDGGDGTIIYYTVKTALDSQGLHRSTNGDICLSSTKHFLGSTSSVMVTRQKNYVALLLARLVTISIQK
jgi:hypothetical protein